MRIERIERHSDRDGLAVSKSILGDLLKLVRRPVAKVQRSGFLHLEGIPSVGDVVQVHEHARADRWHHSSPIPSGDILSMLA